MKFSRALGLKDLVTFIPNKKEPIHNWYYFKEGFSKQLVDIFIDEFNLNENSVVLDPFCIAPDSRIICNPEVRVASRIEIGDKVLTHNGNFKEVVKIFKRKYNGEIVKIRTIYSNKILKLTENHPILAVKISKCFKDNKRICKINGCKFHKNRRYLKCPAFYKSYQPKWIKAGDLEYNDLVVFPVPREIGDIRQLNFESKKRAGKGKWNIIVKSIPCNEEICRLIGYYLAEGFSDDYNLVFVFNSQEKEYIQDVIYLVNKYFRKRPEIIRKKNNKSIRLRFYSRDMVVFFTKYCGKLAYRKRLNNLFLFLPSNKQKEIVKAIFRGDGSIAKDGFDITTTSQQLAFQIKIILLRLGTTPSLIETKPEKWDSIPSTKNRIINGKLIKSKHTVFQIKIYGKQLKNMTKIFDLEHSWIKKRKHTTQRGFMKDNFVFIPITRIEKDYVKDFEVLNFQIKDDNSYTLENFTVHNCGVGTTLLACKQRGIKSVGFDISPFFIFVSKVKIRDYDLNELRKAVSEALKWKFEKPESLPKENFIRRAFSRYTLEDTIFYKNKILEIEDEKARDFLLLALIDSSMKSGWALKDGALVRIEKKGKPPLKKYFKYKIRKMLKDLEKTKLNPVFAVAEVGDARKIDLDDNTIDAIITSPPYLNKIEYTKIYKIETSLFFDFPETEIKSYIASKVEDTNVRELGLDENLPIVAKTYFKDMDQVLKEFYRVCKDDARLAIVVGGGCFPDRVVEADRITAEIAERNGFKIRNILVARNSWCTRARTIKVGQIRESIILLEK